VLTSGTSEAYAHLFPPALRPGRRGVGAASELSVVRAARGAGGRAARLVPAGLRRALASRPRLTRARDRAAHPRGDHGRAESSDRHLSRRGRPRVPDGSLPPSRSGADLRRGVRRLRVGSSAAAAEPVPSRRCSHSRSAVFPRRAACHR
jgi:hypothetical protein